MATINVVLPDDKIDNLVDMFKARYGITENISKVQDKLDFLGKILSHETIQIIRQAIVEEAQRVAQGQILADNGIKKTAFEAELEAKAQLLVNDADQVQQAAPKQ